VLRHASRRVARVERDGVVLFVKVETRGKRLDEAAAEMRAHLALRAAGFRAPEPWVALSGRRADGSRASVLATREEPGTPLDRLLAPSREDRSRARPLALAVGRALRALHTARFVSPDLLAWHVLVDGPPEGGLRSIAFLDLARLARARGRVGPEAAASGLAALALSLRPVTSRRLRLTVLRGYLGGSLSGARPFLRAIDRRIRRIRRVGDRGTFRRLADAPR
jgi:hypothetical protein